jgi:hypothetical protein
MDEIMIYWCFPEELQIATDKPKYVGDIVGRVA